MYIDNIDNLKLFLYSKYIKKLYLEKTVFNLITENEDITIELFWYKTKHLINKEDFIIWLEYDRITINNNCIQYNISNIVNFKQIILLLEKYLIVKFGSQSLLKMLTNLSYCFKQYNFDFEYTNHIYSITFLWMLFFSKCITFLNIFNDHPLNNEYNINFWKELKKKYIICSQLENFGNIKIEEIENNQTELENEELIIYHRYNTKIYFEKELFNLIKKKENICLGEFWRKTKNLLNKEHFINWLKEDNNKIANEQDFEEMINFIDSTLIYITGGISLLSMINTNIGMFNSIFNIDNHTTIYSNRIYSLTYLWMLFVSKCIRGINNEKVSYNHSIIWETTIEKYKNIYNKMYMFGEIKITSYENINKDSYELFIN